MERSLRKSLLIGLVIGDGYINIRRDKRCQNSCQYRLVIAHGAKQKEYLEYKAELLSTLIGGAKPKPYSYTTSNGYAGYRFEKNHRWFRYLRKLLYPNGVKAVTRRTLNYLTPEGIALWYMDDGGLYMKRSRNGGPGGCDLYLNTFLPKEQNQIIIDYFNEVHDVSFHQVLNHGKYRLRCGIKQARKLTQLVSPFIIPSMSYKVDLTYKPIADDSLISASLPPFVPAEKRKRLTFDRVEDIV